MDFALLLNKEIIYILNGDVVVFENYKLPYLTGSQLCKLSTKFGFPVVYNRDGSGNKSRWEYMFDLLQFLNTQNRVPELLSYLLSFNRFTDLCDIGNRDEILKTHQSIVEGAIRKINSYLLFSNSELILVNEHFALVELGKRIIIEAPKIKCITNEYIKDLPKRIKNDLDSGDYDSVITKSRTLIEEVLIYINESISLTKYKSNGDLNKIYQETTLLLNMRQNAEWDKRINELLGALHKIISAISNIRNINSDAHGVGSNRITIQKKEALLVAQSAVILSEYFLSVFQNKE